MYTANPPGDLTVFRCTCFYHNWLWVRFLDDDREFLKVRICVEQNYYFFYYLFSKQCSLLKEKKKLIEALKDRGG